MKFYTEIPALADVVLEESWVLAVLAAPGELTLTVEFVMTLDHPDYHPPRPNEVYGFFTGDLVFSGVSSLHWEQLDMSPSYGPDGEVDWGNIDSMYFEGVSYRLEGDFGKIQLTAQALEIRPIDERSASAE